MALLGSLLWDSFAAIGLLVVVVYVYVTSEFDYFKKRGIPYARPLPFLGSFAKVVAGRDTMMSVCVPHYERFKKNRYGGVFVGGSPTLMVCDPELVKMVLTKDFSSLHDRGTPVDEENDPLSANLVNIPGNRWKNLRSKLAPTFTSGKLKMMFPLMKECSTDLNEHLQESAIQGENIEIIEALVRYCTDVIGTCAFGIQCNSIKNPNSEFYVLSRSIFKPSILATLRFSVFLNNKFLLKIVPFKLLFPGVHNFFINLMKETLTFRKTNNVERNDFVQMMMQQQKNDESKSPEDHPDEVLFTDNIVTAQAFIFFIAGLDSIANTVAFALYHISVNLRLQDDLADEVISVIRNNNGELTYEALKQMHLCERIILETLRMYTPGGILFREVTSPSYTVPDSDLKVPRGFKVIISVQGIHYDPEIYPEPHKFDPDRFTEEAISHRHPYTYLPFGEGPRVCIANRFALLECKLCLASLVKDFKFSVCPETPVPLALDTRTFAGPIPKGGKLHLKIQVRSQ